MANRSLRSVIPGISRSCSPRARRAGLCSALTLLLGAAAAAPAGAEVPRYRKVSVMLANDGLAHHAEGGNLGDVERMPLRWRGNEFTLEYKRPENPKLMRHETNLRGRISADGRTIEKIEVEDLFYYEHLDGRLMQARFQLSARNLPLQPGRVKGSLQADLSGAAVKAAVVSVKWIHSHYGTRGLDYFEPSPRLSVFFDEPEAGAQVVLKGTVSAPDFAGYKPGKVFPLADVPVRLMKEGKELASTFSATDGSYTLSAPAGEKVSLKVELQHASRKSPRFTVVYDLDTEPAWMATPAFVPKAAGKDASGKDLPMTVDVSFAPAKDVATDSRYASYLADLGFMYASTHKAWDEATARLGLTLDLGLPLEVRAFHSSGSPGAPVPMTTGEGDPDPCITLPYDYSVRSRRLREGTIWHEFGHYVMADTFSNLYPVDPAGKFHDGYKNPSTTDSWTEGFATFFALLVNVHQKGEKRSVVDVNGWVIDLGVPWQMPWSQDDGQSVEEMAVAALLWDLHDDQQNEMRLEGTNDYLQNHGLALEGPITDEKPAVAYRDRVSVDARALLAFLTGLAGAQASPPAAPAGYGHVFDVFQLHAALEASGVGQEKPKESPLNALDELFVGHGFFADVAPQNFFWDEGETVALTANGGPLTSGPMSIPRRDVRRYTPLLPNSNLLYEAREPGGTAVAVRRFRVDAHFAPPNQAHDYSFDTWASDPGKLYVLCPDPSIGLAYTVRAESAEYESTRPLELSCEDYWRAKRAGARGSFMTHTFEVRRTRASATLPAAFPSLPAGGSRLLPALLGLAFLVVVGLGLLLLALVLYLRRRPAAPEAPAPTTPPPDQPTRLALAAPDGTVSTRPLTPGTLSIGRSADNDVVFAQPEVSGHHAQIVVTEGVALLRDLGSRNGTFLGDQRVTEAPLQVGDVIRIGGGTIQVE